MPRTDFTIVDYGFFRTGDVVRFGKASCTAPSSQMW
jgi:hypothetical protein